MSQPLIDVFRTNCGATAPLELKVSGPGLAAGERRVFEPPFVLVGRHEQSCLCLGDGEVSRRHAYLQQLGGRVFCVDLGSRTGIRWGREFRPAGWLRPEQEVQIGPFTLQLAMNAEAGEGPHDSVAEDWNPLDDRANDPRFLPRITVEAGNKELSRLHMNRVLLLVGSSPACRVRLRDAGVSKYHCSLLRTPQGVWLIDLLNGNGACLNGQPARWALVKEGDRLQVGPYVLRVWYPDGRLETPPPTLVEIPVRTPVQPADDTAESGQRPAPDQSAPEPAATEVPALQAELDRDREHQRDAEILRQQLADSQAEGERLRAQARTLEVQVAEMAGLQARLEAAEASAGERDHWQAEARNHQTQFAAHAEEREQWRQRLEAVQQQLAQERDAVRAAAARLDQESAALQKVRDDLAARNAEHDAALQRLQETQEQLARVQDEARGLQAGLDQTLERQRGVETLRQELADAEAEHTQLRARIAELEGRADSADRLGAQLRDAAEETERLRAQARTLEVQVAEMAGLQARLEAAETSAGERDGLRGERDHWQAEARNHQTQLAAHAEEREQWRQRLEAVQQQLAQERDAVRAAAARLDQESAALQKVRDDLAARNAEHDAALQRLQETQDQLDRAQDETRGLQAKLASHSTGQEQPDRLAAELHAAQVEQDRLRTEQQTSQNAAEQAWARVSDLERALTETVVTREKTLEDARAGWESERQALAARLELQGHTHSKEIQAAIRDVQSKAAAEREQWRLQLEGAELQLVWERKMFQEQSEPIRQQTAGLQAERDRLAARLAQAELRLRAAEDRSPDEARRAAELQSLGQQAARDQVFVQLSSARMGHLLQTDRAQGADAAAEQARPRAPLVREPAPVEERRLTAIAQEVQDAWGEADADQERLPVLCETPGRAGGQVFEVGLDSGGEKAAEHRSAAAALPDVPADQGEASDPSDALLGSAAPLEEEQPAEDSHDGLPRREDSRPETRQKLWRQILGFVLRK